MKIIKKTLITKKTILNLIIKSIFIIFSLRNLIFLKKKNIISFNDNFNLLLNLKKTKIENAIMITKILPFIKNNLLINIKKREIGVSLFLKNLFNNKKIIDGIIEIKKEDFYHFIKNFENLFKYEWEIIPVIEEINEIRHIINNYYNEICLKIFDKCLNYNLNNYIQLNKYNFTLEEITELMSKLIFI